MYTFELEVSYEGKMFAIPYDLENQIKNQLYPKIISKLQKSGYEHGDYRISFQKKIWELNSSNFRCVHPRKVFENRYVSLSGILFRKHIPKTGPNKGRLLYLAIGNIDVYWEISKECSDEDISCLICESNLTKLLISQLCNFGVSEVKIIANMQNEGNQVNSNEISSVQNLKFYYDIIGEDYPNITFNVNFVDKVTQKHLNELYDFFEQFKVYAYKKNSEENTGIDYIGKAEILSTDDNTASIFVDFGNSDPQIILDVLKEISVKIDHINSIIIS